jgi:hypothetical protein
VRLLKLRSRNFKSGSSNVRDTRLVLISEWIFNIYIKSISIIENVFVQKMNFMHLNVKSHSKSDCSLIGCGTA